MVECDFCGEEFDDEEELHAHWSEHEDELNSHQKDQMKKAKRKKEEREQQKKQKRKKQLIYGFAGVLGLGIAALIVPQLIPQGGAAGQYNLSIEGQPVIGDENASVTVIEFGDYSCGHCRTFEMTTFPQLKENYIDTGQVKFSFINLAFLGPDSQEAAAASECVYRQNETQFWDFHKGVFENQGSEEGWASESLMMEIARDTTEGLDYNQLESCIASGDTMGQVRDERAIANTNGVDSTPTVFVNGRMIEGDSYSRVSQAIESELR